MPLRAPIIDANGQSWEWCDRCNGYRHSQNGDHARRGALSHDATLGWTREGVIRLSGERGK